MYEAAAEVISEYKVTELAHLKKLYDPLETL